MLVARGGAAVRVPAVRMTAVGMRSVPGRTAVRVPAGTARAAVRVPAMRVPAVSGPFTVVPVRHSGLLSVLACARAVGARVRTAARTVIVMAVRARTVRSRARGAGMHGGPVVR